MMRTCWPIWKTAGERKQIDADTLARKIDGIYLTDAGKDLARQILIQKG